jgi:hypothetical protein
MSKHMTHRPIGQPARAAYVCVAEGPHGVQEHLVRGAGALDVADGRGTVTHARGP